MVIPGIDTILKPTGDVPARNPMSFKDMRNAEMLRQRWNKKHIAFIPYCMVCEVPLDWIAYEPNSKMIFQCPKCGRLWVTDHNWSRDASRVKTLTDIVGKPG